MNNCAPRFLLPLSGSREVTEGDSYTLEVRVYGQPQPEVEWSQNGRELTDGYISKPGPQGKYELFIAELGQEHTGEYRCSVVNQYGRVSSAMWLAVVPRTYPANHMMTTPKPTKSQPSSTTSSQSGSNPDNRASPANFYFNNPLTPQRNPPQSNLVDMSERSRSLGNLTGVLNRGKTDQPANFGKQGQARRAPGFLQRPATTRLKPGSKLSLSAKLLGHPAPKVTWEKDGAVINELTDRHRIFNIDNIHTLEIESVNYTDGGVYRIIARNPLGRQQAQATVVVDKNATSARIEPSFNQQQQHLLQSTPSRSSDSSVASSSVVQLSYIKPNQNGNNNVKVNVTPPNSTIEPPLDKPKPPRIVERLQDHTVDTGELLILHCKIEGGTEAVWTLNGFDVKSINGERLHFVTRQFGDNHRLRILNLEPSLSGEYGIKVSNDDGFVTDSCFVKCRRPDTVQWEESSSLSPYKPPDIVHPEFALGLADFQCLEGESVILTVRVTGHPLPIVRFFFDEERFVSDPPNGVTITADDAGNHMLMLEDANPDDSGNYSCVARNEHGHRIETYCRVTVQPAPPSITYAPELVNVYYGEPFSIEIETDAENVEWDYGPERAEKVGVNRFRLFCPCARKADNVAVIATSGQQSTKATCRLNLTRKQLTPPKFQLDLPSELSCRLGERCTFPVEFSGDEVDVKWTFNQGPLSSDFQVKTITGSSTTAIITQMKETLNGELKCQLTNESGTIGTACHITYVRQAPIFVKTPKKDTYELEQGEPITLDFEYDGIPVPVPTWTFNGKPMLMNISMQRKHTQLTIEHVEQDNDGNYSCHIENEAGYAQFEFAIVVNKPPPTPPPPAEPEPEVQQPELKVIPIVEADSTTNSDGSVVAVPARILEGLKDKTFAEGEDIVLRCRVEGKPSPTVSWSLGDEPIWSGPPDEGGLSELILKDCWSDDMGIYKIHVANEHGADESECNVIVQQRLKPMLEPQGPIEPMETILEVSEISSRATSADHSRTTSADSHRTETQARQLCLDNLSETIESANDLILSSTQITQNQQQPPYFIEAPVAREIGDGEKDFCWRMVINAASKLTVYKMNDETKEWDETELDGELSINQRGDEFELCFKEVYPDDAGTYKFHASNSDGKCEVVAALSVIPAEGSAPTFITKPRSREYKLGSPAIFSCSIEADPTPQIKWEINGQLIDTDRTAIYESKMEDGSTRSELTIRSLDKVDVGRGLVTASNIHGNISCQFSILLAPNEEPTITTDFRSQLKNKVQTKALTAEDLTQANIQQFDFRSNLKKSKTNENLADLKFDSDSADEPVVQLEPELNEKFKRIRATIDEPSTQESDDICDLTSVSDLPADHELQSTQINSTLDGLVDDMKNLYPYRERPSASFIVPQYESESMESSNEGGHQAATKGETTLDMIGEMSKSRQSVHSHASSSSKASTVLNSVAPEEETDDLASDPGCAPIIIKGLSDETAQISMPFKLEIIAEHAEKVTWMLEQEEILPEPEEGLIILAEGNTYTLLVAVSMAEDMGTYDVIVENRHGTRRSNCFLTIVDKAPSPPPPQPNHHHHTPGESEH